MSKKSGARFPGQLGKPIVRRNVLLTGSREASSNWIVQQKVAKIRLLAARYGIDPTSNPNAWTAVLIKLAEECLDGFKVVDAPGGRGRPRGSGKGTIDRRELCAAVDALVGPGKSIAEACRELSDRKGKWFGKSPKSLEVRYQQGKTERRELEAILSEREAVLSALKRRER